MQQRYYDPVAGRFLSVDPVVTDNNTGGSFNRYNYARNSPYKYIDPDGRIAETPWDAFNVALGATSMAVNLGAGNYGKAAVDAAGLAYDSVATAVPILPGGAATAINASRVANAASHIAPAVAKVEKAVVAGEKVVFRRGANDTKKLLETQAASAEKVIGVHGVSVSTSAAAKEGQVVRSATCCSLEKAGFKVTQTGKDLNHHTVELPKPITAETARTWNELFK